MISNSRGGKLFLQMKNVSFPLGKYANYGEWLYTDNKQLLDEVFEYERVRKKCHV